MYRLTILLGLCAFAHHSFAQLTGLELETVLVHPSTPYATPAGDVSLEGYTTFRVYATVTNFNTSDDTDDYVSAVFGEAGQITTLQTTGGEMWQSPFGGGLAGQINPDFFPANPSLMYDSWITIGQSDLQSPPGTVTAFGGNDNDDDFLATFESTGGFELSGGIGGLWFTLNDEYALGAPDGQGRVLLGQFTTNGCVSGTFWIQSFVNGVMGDATQYAAYDFTSCSCTDILACNYFPSAITDDGSCTYPGCIDSTACNYDSSAGCEDDSCTYPGCTDSNACNYDSSSGCEDDSCTYPGCTDSTACNYDFSAGCDDGSCTYPGCTDSNACNYDFSAGCEDGSCTYPGCIDSTACNYDSSAGCDDGACEFTSCAGCTDPEACNYDDADTIDDGSCTYPGCTDSNACNYDSSAGCEDGSCTYPGCTDSNACNFNPSAGCNDGSCTYPGCTDSLACNYQSAAGCDDGSCSYPGCTDPNSCNYNMTAGCDDESCTYPGCTDSLACNYVASAGCNDGSCTYPGCTDSLACNYWSDAGCDDDSCTYPGCTDSLACNYDVNAGCNDGSCTYPGCTDALASNYDPTAGCDDGSCIAAFGSLEWQVASTMYYSDTLEVNMLITGGEDVYAAFATIEYDTSVLLMVEDQLGDYLGDEIIATPAVDDNGTVEFGATKLGALPGSNGDGLFYTLRFIPVGPIEATSIETALTVVDIEAYTSEGAPGALYFPDSWSVELIYQAEVWPGDLNHDYEVTVGDILPIGYFYAETGPVRPDATLQWEAQLCPLWDVGMDFAGDGFYKVFADGNGDGEIQLSDQVAVGININQVVNLVPGDDQTAWLVGGGSSPVLITATSNPDPLVLPEDSEVSLVVYATTDEINQADFHGISFSLDFESLGIEADLAEVDYSNSGMGVLNSTMIALDYAEGFQLDVAITRTNTEYVLGQFELCTVTLPISNLAGGAYPIPVTVSEANDAEGVAVVTEASPALVNITNATGCTDATACNYDSTASNDDGSCTYVGDPCDDQDPETTNDLLQDDCSCAGEIVVSVDGCTDPEACNYNPEATTDDGSCTYVESLVISGPVTPESFSTTTYTYPETAGSTYTWTVEGGIITAGQGTASIEVVWSTEGSGNVSLTETNAEGCTGELVTLEVVIFPTNIEEQDASSFSFYPNPANTTITITADAALLNSPYRITDSQGKLVKAGVLQGATTTLDVTSLDSGKYTVGITSNARLVTQTLIIQK